MFDKTERSSFKYWFAHWCSFNMVALNQKCWKFKYLFHDMEKPFLKLILPYKTLQKFHRFHNKHHPEYYFLQMGKYHKCDNYDYEATIYDQRHSGANCPGVYNAYPVNMSPVKLDASSTKKKPNVADILYSTADGKLTLDAQTNNVDNTPIAICVIPEVTENFKNGDDSEGAVKTARFVSLNYMNYNTPTTGNKDTQTMRFGNYGTTIGNVKGGTNSKAYIGGKWNTQQCLSKATNQDQNICDGVTNNSGEGYCAPACCCVAYSTPGTKSGDWYLPMPGELYQIYANKTAINEKRTAIKGSGFSDNYYWSSREGSSNGEYRVDLINGNFAYSFKLNHLYVLGFLALEV